MSREIDRHRRTLPAVPLDEAAIRQLEIWLLDLLNVKLKGVQGASGWRFNIENLGANEPTGLGWGYVITNSMIDIGYGILGLVLYDIGGGGVLIGTEEPPGSSIGDKGAATSMIHGQWSGGVHQVTASGPYRAVSLLMEVVSGAATVTIPPTDGSFTIKDNADPVSREYLVKDADLDLHLPVGGNIIFDLPV